MASRPFPRSMSEDRKNIPSVSVAGQASTCPTVAANSGPRPIRSSDRARTDHRDTLPATQFDGLFFLFSGRTAAGRHRRLQPVQRPDSRNEQDGARSNRPGTPHRDRAAPLGLDHAPPVELPERTATRIGCAMRRDQAAVGGIRTNLAVIGLRIGSVGAILFHSCGTPVAGSTRSARGPRVRIAMKRNR